MMVPEKVPVFPVRSTVLPADAAATVPEKLLPLMVPVRLTLLILPVQAHLRPLSVVLVIVPATVLAQKLLSVEII